ncbi:MAG TPA: LEA type 2 family protein, partial [Longimicrobiaceae bacterium]|nr:LEA type 2 family protein [Longimicrobiaceae bacterium]
SRMFRQPQVILHNVELAGLGLRGGTLLVNLEVSNPNRFALNANQLQYQLAIANTESSQDTVWLDLASGTYAEPFSVGPGRTEQVQVPVEFSYTDLGGAASSVLRAGTFNYRATGTVDVRTPVGTYEVPFRRGGMVSLLGAR